MNDALLTFQSQGRHIGSMTSRTSIEDRFFAKVRKTKTCWLWTASLSAKGYGQFRDGDRIVYAHRFAYKLLVGPIPEELELDHVRAWGCTNKHCVNPAHLEAVTHTENLRRGSNAKRDKTHCPHGHEYAGDNLYVEPDGHRHCRECVRSAGRAYRRRKRQHIKDYLQ